MFLQFSTVPPSLFAGWFRVFAKFTNAVSQDMEDLTRLFYTCMHWKTRRLSLVTQQLVKFNPALNNLLIIDDLMEDLCNVRKAATLLTRDMHHNNVTVFFTAQICLSKAIV